MIKNIIPLLLDIGHTVYCPNDNQKGETIFILDRALDGELLPQLLQLLGYEILATTLIPDSEDIMVVTSFPYEAYTNL